MQTLQTAGDLKNFKRQQAFIMVEDSKRSGFNKNTVGTLDSHGIGDSTVELNPLRSKRVKPFAGNVHMTVSSLYEDPKTLAPLTIGMSVKPQEGWKVIKP